MVIMANWIWIYSTVREACFMLHFMDDDFIKCWLIGEELNCIINTKKKWLLILYVKEQLICYKCEVLSRALPVSSWRIMEEFWRGARLTASN